MKKFLTLSLVGVMTLLASIMLIGCGKDKTITDISVTDISVIDMPKYVVQGDFDLAKIEAKLTYSDDSTEKIFVTEDMLSAEDKAKVDTLGEQTITINYEGKTATVEVNIVTKAELLDNLMNDLMDIDFSFTGIGYTDNVESVRVQGYYDASSSIFMTENIIGTSTVDSYVWINGDYCFSGQQVNDGEIYVSSMSVSSFNDRFFELFGFHPEILNNSAIYSNVEFTLDSNNNYVFTGTENEGNIHRITFNNRGVLSISKDYEEASPDHVIVTLNTNDAVELTVPDEYRALEDSAIGAE